MIAEPRVANEKWKQRCRGSEKPREGRDEPTEPEPDNASHKGG